MHSLLSINSIYSMVLTFATFFPVQQKTQRAYLCNISCTGDLQINNKFTGTIPFRKTSILSTSQRGGISSVISGVNVSLNGHHRNPMKFYCFCHSVVDFRNRSALENNTKWDLRKKKRFRRFCKDI